MKKVNIIGEQAERIFVSFSHDRLATLGVSPQDIFSVLNSQNVLTPAGSIDTKGPQVFIRTDGAFDKLEKIRETPLLFRAGHCNYRTWRPLSGATKIRRPS